MLQETQSRQVESHISPLVEAEKSARWADEPLDQLADRLLQVAQGFYQLGDRLASDTAGRMGVTAAEVWLEVIFPSVWGTLATFHSLRSLASRRSSSSDSVELATPPVTLFGDQSAIRMVPGTLLENLLLPGFQGHLLLSPQKGRKSTPRPAGSLALCLLPFNLASIGALDIVHLLCNARMRVVAKVSEKSEFMGSYLERIFAPFVKARALSLAYGGPDVGSWLAARPEFTHVHLTGSFRTGAAVERIAGRQKVTCELGGVTPAIILPDAISSRQRLRHTARQLAFGSLANNGQHCVSFQVVIVPRSQQSDLEGALWKEMSLASTRSKTNGACLLIDPAAAEHVESLVEGARGAGALVRPTNPKRSARRFPACLISNVSEKMRFFSEEAFGPVVGVIGLPDRDFQARALDLVNQPNLTGDLGGSIFSADSDSEGVRQLACSLKHGVVTINTYPGVTFATSLPWGAGPTGVSGRGWVHNYYFLSETRFQKVVLDAGLGRKGFGPLAWEDPWLLNVSTPATLGLAKALVGATLGFFRWEPQRCLFSQLSILKSLVQREFVSRAQDRDG